MLVGSDDPFLLGPSNFSELFAVKLQVGTRYPFFGGESFRNEEP